MQTLNANTQQNIPQIPLMLSLKQFEHYTGLSSTTIYDMLDRRSKHYDPTFPVQVKLSKGLVACVEGEVVQWIEDKIAGR